MHITIDSDIPYIRGVLEQYASIEYIRGSEIDADKIRTSDALIIRTRTRCNEKLLKGSNVKVIATATIGTDHIDMEYCHRSGIKVYNAAGCNARGVLQWVSAALRHIVGNDKREPSDYRLGVVGVGNVGSLVAQYARHWGFDVMECDPPRQAREGGNFQSLEQLVKECNILTFHTPLDESTHHLLNKSLITQLRPDAIIINASRGAVVDNTAVANSSHRYYFDVWENEPNIEPIVLSNSSLATPHVAGYSMQGKANATAMVITAICNHFDLPLKGWYPSNVKRTTPQLISWREMCNTIDQYYPISEESKLLKLNPELFETLRNKYVYRQEYF